MHKYKTARRSRLIRKWDGSRVGGVHSPGSSASTESTDSSSPRNELKSDGNDLALDFEREDELTDPLSR
jgi:hypothetical protein